MSGHEKEKDDTQGGTRVIEGILSLSVIFFSFYHSLLSSPITKDVFTHFIWEKTRNVQIGVSFPGNIQAKDSFPLDPDCAEWSLADVPN